MLLKSLVDLLDTYLSPFHRREDYYILFSCSCLYKTIYGADNEGVYLFWGISCEEEEILLLYIETQPFLAYFCDSIKYILSI